jgi:hypothetical protein
VEKSDDLLCSYLKPGGRGTGMMPVQDRTPVVRVPVLSKAMLVQEARASKTAAPFTRMPLLLTAAMAAMYASGTCNPHASFSNLFPLQTGQM